MIFVSAARWAVLLTLLMPYNLSASASKATQRGARRKLYPWIDADSHGEFIFEDLGYIFNDGINVYSEDTFQEQEKRKTNRQAWRKLSPFKPGPPWWKFWKGWTSTYSQDVGKIVRNYFEGTRSLRNFDFGIAENQLEVLSRSLQETCEDANRVFVKPIGSGAFARVSLYSTKISSEKTAKDASGGFPLFGRRFTSFRGSGEETTQETLCEKETTVERAMKHQVLSLPLGFFASGSGAPGGASCNIEEDPTCVPEAAWKPWHTPKGNFLRLGVSWSSDDDGPQVDSRPKVDVNTLQHEYLSAETISDDAFQKILLEVLKSNVDVLLRGMLILLFEAAIGLYTTALSSACCVPFRGVLVAISRTAIQPSDDDVNGEGPADEWMHHVHLVYEMDNKKKSLKEELDNDICRPKTGKRLTPLQLLRTAVKTGRALQGLHEAGWAHNDIKPDNVLVDGGILSESFAIELADFGSAAPVGGTQSDVGTPFYQDPDTVGYPVQSNTGDWGLARNEKARCKAGDTWAFGVMFYRMPLRCFAPSSGLDTAQETLEKGAVEHAEQWMYEMGPGDDVLGLQGLDSLQKEHWPGFLHNFYAWCVYKRWDDLGMRDNNRRPWALQLAPPPSWSTWRRADDPCKGKSEDKPVICRFQHALLRHALQCDGEKRDLGELLAELEKLLKEEENNEKERIHRQPREFLAPPSESTASAASGSAAQQRRPSAPPPPRALASPPNGPPVMPCPLGGTSSAANPPSPPKDAEVRHLLKRGGKEAAPRDADSNGAGASSGTGTLAAADIKAFLELEDAPPAAIRPKRLATSNSQKVPMPLQGRGQSTSSSLLAEDGRTSSTETTSSSTSVDMTSSISDTTSSSVDANPETTSFLQEQDNHEDDNQGYGSWIWNLWSSKDGHDSSHDYRDYEDAEKRSYVLDMFDDYPSGFGAPRYEM
ncbi:unnamed protein product [Amoebophrya sp. A25]|nr:unnamed protein product [Amoebophrya sp. A25]|eukprot:GSA25T00025670001.1